MSKTAKIEINDIFLELKDENIELKNSFKNCEKLIKILLKFKDYFNDNKCDYCLCHSNEDLCDLGEEFTKCYEKFENDNKLIDNKLSENSELIEKSNNNLIDNSFDISIDKSLDFEYNSHRINSKSFSYTNGVFSCNSCDKQFPYLSGIRRHISIHTQNKQFVCQWPECKKSFLQKDQLKGHYLRIHVSQQTDQDFSYLVESNSDEKVIKFKRNSNFQFECEECGLEFKFCHQLKRHFQSHRKPFRCRVCDRSFGQKANVKEHFLRHHSDQQVFPNSTDEVIVESTDSGQQKTIEKNVEGFYECDWYGCGQQFRHPSGLKRHSVVHYGDKPFKCPQCERSFGQKSARNDHYFRIHKANDKFKNILNSIHKKYSINKLKIGFNNNMSETQLIDSSYSRQYSHNGLYYYCKWLSCDRQFRSFSGMRRHLFTHEGQKPYKCVATGCQRTFAQKSNMVSHYSNIHCSRDLDIFDHNSNQTQDLNNSENLLISEIERQKRKMKKYPKTNLKIKDRKQYLLSRRQKTVHNCPHINCNRMFDSRSKLEAHEKSVHNSDNPIKCSFEGCVARFRRQAHYEQHLKRHLVEYRCSLEDCHYRTHLESSLKIHMSKHKGEELYKCEICDNCFAFLGALNTHKKKVHSIDCPLVCEWPGCENSYKTVAGLRKHKSLHTGEKPYKCSWPECEQRFRHNSGFKIHMAQHTGLKPYKCGLCDRVFASTDYLREHKRRIHR